MLKVGSLEEERVKIPPVKEFQPTEEEKELIAWVRNHTKSAETCSLPMEQCENCRAWVLPEGLILSLGKKRMRSVCETCGSLDSREMREINLIFAVTQLMHYKLPVKKPKLEYLAEVFATDSSDEFSIDEYELVEDPYRGGSLPK